MSQSIKDAEPIRDTLTVSGVSKAAQATAAAQRQALSRLTPGERIALALQLGRRDIEIYCKAHNVTEAEARRRFARAKRLGRTPSRCMEEQNESGTSRGE